MVVCYLCLGLMLGRLFGLAVSVSLGWAGCFDVGLWVSGGVVGLCCFTDYLLLCVFDCVVLCVALGG